MRLAKAGFFGGDPSRVMESGVDMVLSALDYETFLGEYEAQAYRMGREDI